MEQTTSPSLSIDGRRLRVAWEGNAAVEALRALAREEPLAISTTRYGGFEQVGVLPWSLPRQDAHMTAEAGDILLYSGNRIVVFFGENSWEYTKLGRIEGLSAQELSEVLGGRSACVRIAVDDPQH